MDEQWDDRDRHDERVYQRDEPENAPPAKMGYEQRGALVGAQTGDDLWEMHAAASRIAEFTAGCGAEEWALSEVLEAAVRSMLGILAAGFGRLESEAPELAGKVATPEEAEGMRRAADPAALPAAVWNFVQGSLPEWQARLTAELEGWHAG